MAFVKTPTDYFAGWAEDGTDITVPIASFAQLSAAEADGATGDIRNIVHAILEELWSTWKDLPAADKPVKMTMTKSATVNTTTGETTNYYSIQVVTTTTGAEVATEPA